MQRVAPLLLVIALWVPASASAQNPERLYRSACDSGDLVACNVFGLMNETGQGVPRDLGRARDLYQRACDGGEMVACTNLGLLYGRGLGVPQDLQRARDRYQAACGGGDTLGCDLLAALDSAGVGTAPAVAARAGDVPADSAGPTFFKTGRVADAENARGLSDVVVEVPDLGIETVSDVEGRVSLGRLTPGRYFLRASRFGYESVDGMLEVPGSAGFLVLMNRARIDDPLASGRIAGAVTDANSSEPVSNVYITVEGQPQARVLSNGDGRFVLRDLKPGIAEVHLERLGYRTKTSMLVVQPGGTAELATTMSSEAIELAPIDVTASAQSAYLQRNGFYQRTRTSTGAQFTRQDLDRYQVFEISDAVRHVAGVTVNLVSRSHTPSVPVSRIATSRRSQSGIPGACVLPVYIDGVRMPTPELDQISQSQVEAMEVYVGSHAPIQYRDPNGCGAVLIWTKR